MLEELVGKVVLVRDQMAGVHVGTLVSFDPSIKTAKLTKARKIWRWVGAGSVHGIAVNGLNQKQSKIDVEVPSAVSTNVIEIVECSEKGAESVLRAPVWAP